MKKLLSIILLASINLFAGIGAGESASTPIPVELTSFSSKVVGNVVELNWTTATEVKNYGFDIERASRQVGTTPIQGWEKIGFVEGHGNSNSPKEYSFTDKISNSFGYVSYRLKQIDNDGKFSYSNIISVVINQIQYCFELYQNYPNPFNPSTMIPYSIPKTTHVVLTVYDVLGNIVSTLVNEQKEAGNYSVRFDASMLSNGVYYYRIRTDEYAAIKKMILLK